MYPNDNLRIFDFLKKNKPSIYKRSLSSIKESYNILVLLVHHLFGGSIKNVVGIVVDILQFQRHLQKVVEYIPQLLHNVARVMEYIPQLLEKIKQILQMLGE